MSISQLRLYMCSVVCVDRYFRYLQQIIYTAQNTCYIENIFIIMLTTAFKNRVDHNITYDLIPLVLIIDRFNFVIIYTIPIYTRLYFIIRGIWYNYYELLEIKKR